MLTVYVKRLLRPPTLHPHGADRLFVQLIATAPVVEEAATETTTQAQLTPLLLQKHT